ncbi:hypothetical protein [Pedobacter sp.]|jgi:YD repeat-containing protein|uniref:hypothetical protein n=1 Tax=Pedobacter sp. TaxID=1411316 RepID=UPI002B5B7599|nr:hypothetical protein [Pedobacter sp.]HWW39811.1 hypothetical protein [Pedobacter sp.]
MKKTIIVLMVLIFAVVRNIDAQITPALNKILTPSPDAASLGQFGTYPTRLYNGLIDIDIPVYTIHLGDLEVPIKLSYHASGIRVGEVASNVGLGWAMNVGGVITRQINGTSDENGLGYTSQYKTSAEISAMTPIQRNQYMIEFVGTECMPTVGHDIQSDVFSYTYPGGGGSFMYDLNTKSYFPIENPLIKINGNNGAYYFMLTAENGNRYYYQFGESTNSSISSSNFRSSSASPSATTAFYLTKIVAANNIDSVMFQYDAGEEIDDSDRQISYNNNTDVGKSYSPPTLETQYIQTRTQTGILSAILANNIRVEFGIARDRQDRRKIRYTGVKVVDILSSNTIKEVKLNHSYFLGDLESPNPNNARLRLDKVQIYDAKSSNPQDYNLSYNSLQLPNYFTTYDKTNGIMSVLNIPNYAKDYLGYFNGKYTNGSLVPNSLQLPTSLSGIPVGDRSTDAYYMQACMLTEIKYPTGGKTKFEYEPNVVFNDFSPGLRIKDVRNYDSNGNNTTTKTYRYGQSENGYGRHTSLYLFSPQTFFTYNQLYSIQPSGALQPDVGTNYVYNSFSQAPLSGASGTPVFYQYVTEYLGDKDNNIGKNEYTYDFVLDVNKNIPTIIDASFNTWSTQKNFFSYFDNSWQRGQLLELKQYENKGGNYVVKKHTINTYGTVNRQIKNVGTFIEKRYIQVGGPCATDDLGHACYYSDLVFETNSKLLLKTVDSCFEGNSVVMDSVRYTYSNFNHLKPSLIQKSDSKGNNIYTKYSYTADFSTLTGNDDFSSSLRSLSQKNVRILPVEETNFISRQGVEKLIFSYLTKYNGTTTLKDKVYWIEDPVNTPNFTKAANLNGVFQMDDRYKEYLKFNYSSQSGKLLEQQKTDNAKEVYLWGYNSQYPIAKIVGSNYSAVSSIISQSQIDAATSIPNNDQALRNLLNNLRNNITNVQVWTYTYAPLIGMTSETDPKGQTIYYEYDDFQRLKNVKDRNGDVIKSTTYHYKP